MAYRYYIDSDNTYLALAIHNILDSIGPESQAVSTRRMRIVVLSEKKRIQDLLTVKNRRIEDYDLIICSEPYYSLCRQYLVKGKGNIVSLDKGLKALQKDLYAYIHNRKDVLYSHDVSRLNILTQDERITITNYISQNDYRYMAQTHVRDGKAISRLKRAAMLKLGYRNNMVLWLAINFLFFLGYITLSPSERNDKKIYHSHSKQLQDNHFSP